MQTLRSYSAVAVVFVLSSHSLLASQPTVEEIVARHQAWVNSTHVYHARLTILDTAGAVAGQGEMLVDYDSGTQDIRIRAAQGIQEKPIEYYAHTPGVDGRIRLVFADKGVVDLPEPEGGLLAGSCIMFAANEKPERALERIRSIASDVRVITGENHRAGSTALSIDLSPDYKRNTVKKSQALRGDVNDRIEAIESSMQLIGAIQMWFDKTGKLLEIAVLANSEAIPKQFGDTTETVLSATLFDYVATGLSREGAAEVRAGFETNAV